MYTGVVSTYFYYKTTRDVMKLSLGKFSSLKEIALTQDLNSVCKQIKYYYLQGWSEYNNKLSYKSDYKPVEFLARCVSSDWTENPQCDKGNTSSYSSCLFVCLLVCLSRFTTQFFTNRQV